ncbi:MAG: nitroreductase family protein, partial [Oscillospiraceae bacterium]|nr:nitroreductase family protein [Oscillospiraceae bacterium]
MTDFYQLASERHSCRTYEEKAVEKEKILKCLEAARMAPSGCNSQPWRFVVVTNPETLQKLSK